ncbi:MAG: FkbM family methyltransferase [Candidatus Cloacimonetes bacterium]|nr:FkbM family methyltransferase [Candidatus Cloacimonadota bacterium]
MSIPFIPNEKHLSINLSDGFSITVPNDITEISTFTFLEQETWFETDKSILAKLLPDNFKAIDIGANYGFYSLFMANLQKENSQILSIEPCKSTMDCLKDSISTNSFTNITPVQIGLSDSKTDAYLSIQESSELNEVTYEKQKDGEFETIQLDTLDNIYKMHNFNGCHFIKLDAEGHEKQVLNGAHHFFSKETPIVMLEIKHSDKINLSLLKSLEQLGYSIFQLDSPLNRLRPFQQNISDPLLLNVFAIPNIMIESLKQRNLILEDIPMKLLSNDYLSKFFTENDCYQQLGFSLEVLEHTKRVSSNYWDSINYFLASKDVRLDSNDRHMYLKQSYESLRQIAINNPQVPATLSLIRVSIEIRDITLAMELANYLLQEIINNQTLEVNSFFLALDEKYENARTLSPKWLEEQLIYIQEVYGNYSSIFDGDSSFARTSKLIHFKNYNPLILRKNILCNLGDKSEFIQKLSNNSEHHLNANIWKEVPH